ncbi:MAG: 2-C-methyl-D-erythritol 2,4-cyclodiphosphate synthase [Fimbriimonas ginsengisoli]|uniref:Bifunctional enzyme IspD/IspF n=1 Tax=Fimbriimonas ginsengisoli TaxID=1005039 RepID=A0A931LSV6_FIMGI|nr:2-C-methyl-D-erythritol 2,4-cyclodiphosphate synthase [Fimbriimonas ginsengisoli]
MKVVAVILAGGKGSRFGSNKLLEPLGGKALWRWSYDALRLHPAVSGVGLVVRSEARLTFAGEAPEASFVVEGGETRRASSYAACSAAPADADAVLIHDGARPFPSTRLISDVVAAIERKGAAAPGLAVTDTLRRSVGKEFERVSRDGLFAMQTPQGGWRDLLLKGHETVSEEAPDEIALVEALGQPYEIVPGDPANIKVTLPEDLARARASIEGMETRTGIGYDVHRFSSVPGRRLMLGGIEFAGHQGLDGHSDADALAHAIADALLGAAGLGDIGQRFPNSEPQWRNEPSSAFLAATAGWLAEAGWRIVHIDTTVLAEAPKVMPRAREMCAALARALGIEPGRVSVKATTHEGLGAIGRGEGIAAMAVATIRRA